MRIAVIGGGISGIYAAHELSGHHDVTLFEARDRLGGHTDTHHLTTNHGTFAVDTGFIVFNERNYPLFSEFIGSLGVRSKPSDMSFGVSDRGSGFEYNATNIRGLLCDRRNLFRLGFYRMLMDIFRFYRNSPDLLDTENDTLSIGDYLDANGYSAEFIRNHIIPMSCALWSSPPDTVSRFPARYFIAFMQNHFLLQLSRRPQWRTIEGGSSAYVRSFQNVFRGRLETRCTVRRIEKVPNGLNVCTDDDRSRYDAVVLACHSDQAGDMLDEHLTEQKSVLGKIPYHRNEVILHTDASVMPCNLKAWASWNVVRLPHGDQEFMVTYYMNLLQGIRHARPLLVTLNAGAFIDRDKILVRRQYDHPVYTPESLRAQRDLSAMSGRDALFFSGAYLGWGFHEDGVRSARRAVDAIEKMRMSDAA